ncbi:MAG: phosphoenolpyruvate--protein phosphotransferase [Rhodospirillaceae bacterium]|jgi:phosphotransferase system, enzyme I, PtsP|nr:phosphoenolpyruvate--protein phosphotransferase [Rhodospirillaceae bacterium]
MAEIVETGVRQLLRSVRAVMAGHGTTQERLDELVKVIAGEMMVEVCTVYVLRAGEVLELFATEGLNPSAIHQTRLRVDEGLIGQIAAHARVLNLADAQAHPNFAYRPETGEEIYNSFLGVPILRGGRVRGVLAIQSAAQRQFTEEEVEALEIIVVVLAELIAGGDLVSPGEQMRPEGNAVLPTRLTGIQINAGTAIGEAVLHQPRVPIPRMFADDPEAEEQRLLDALEAMQLAIENLFSATELAERGEHREVLETYQLVAQDAGWLRRLREAITGGLTAEAAVQKVHDDMETRMSMAGSPYLRERLHDFEDLANRLLQHLGGPGRTAAAADLPEDVVLLARNMGPAELLDYEPHRLRALLLEEGSAKSHVAIVARALNIPVVGRITDLLRRIDPRDPVIVDGDHAQVFVRPSEDIQQMVAETIRAKEERRLVYAAMRTEPAVTRDGVRISLNLNAGLLIDVQQLEDTGADGIGLFRSEIPFMVRSELPSVEAQTELYSRVLDIADDRPVMFRTLDIGGDKQLPYFHDSMDQNPNMGWRAIRVGLDRPSMLRQQLRALINGAAGRDLAVMFPMVSEVAEFDAARSIFDIELARCRQRGQIQPKSVRVGVMLEVPGLMWQLAPLLSRVDFLSVGSNDLFQFLFASDRGNPRVAERYDVLSPGLLSLLRHLVAECDRADVPLSLCGEMAGNPVEAMALIGLGFRIISMPPAQVGAVRAMIRSMDAGQLRGYLDTLFDLPDHSLRRKLTSYARDREILIDDS